MRGVILRRAAVAVALLMTVAAPRVDAQAVTPSSEDLEVFRNLTPEQREAVLDRMGNRAGEARGDDAADAGRRGTPAEGRRRDRGDTREDGDESSTGDEADGTDPSTRTSTGAVAARKPRLKPDDTLLVELEFPLPPVTEYIIPPGAPAGTPPIAVPPPEPKEPVDEAEKKRLERLVELIRSRNPYVLDRNGVLQLPGVPGIALAGLTEEQARSRLKAEAVFRDLQVKVTRLPLARVGVEGLKPFGYDIFGDPDGAMLQEGDLPVPAEYVVGPGDRFVVQLYGNQNRTLRLTVDRDGRVNFPELGPISVGGRAFENARATIEGRVRSQLIGVRASVSMGDARSISVFVLGEAKAPGAYTVSGLGTVTTALYAAGGVKSIGSLRDIQLKRQGAVVRRLDLYDLLLRGDTSNDAKLLPGDVIFIPPVGATVSIEGEVRRPAIYELARDALVADAVQLAGGLTATAETRRAALSRVDEAGRRVVVDVDLGSPEGRSRVLRNGDVLRVARIRPQIDSGIVLRGHVHTPGAVAWRQDIRLSDVIGSVDELKPNADLGYVLIRRELPPDRRIVVLSADLSVALRERGGDADVRLSPRDEITVFDLETSRDLEIRRVLEEIRLQARIDRPTNIVRVGGRVRLPGEYPLEPNMTVSDLIRAGGNLSDAAYGGKAELTRYSVVDGEARRTELIEIDLAKILLGDKEADVALRPFDFLNIQEIPEWTAQEKVTLRGEVKFPGEYPIKRGETLRSLLQRAGGLTDLAFAEGGVFTRRTLREREQQQLDQLAQRLQSDLATMALQSAAANQAAAGQANVIGQSLLQQLKASKAVGRLVIDVDDALAGRPGSSGDIVLLDGDVLSIPKRSQEVTVIGEVQTATSHFYRPRLERDDYVGLSGGTTRRADRGGIYVVRANGSVVSSESTKWFSRGSRVEIQPGDTIVVPLDTERLPRLPLWQAVTQIVYNLAISAAAVNSF
jgi:protein involved in polysaccharide export with SLBB domain